MWTEFEVAADYYYNYSWGGGGFVKICQVILLIIVLHYFYWFNRRCVIDPLVISSLPKLSVINFNIYTNLDII